MAETPDSKAPHATSKEVRRPQLISGQIDGARAWHAAEIGNAIEASASKYNPVREAKAVEEVEELATRDRLEGLAPFGHQTRAPIFVVGMPRSGTTLLESIIAEHPQVLAAGELTALGVIGKMVSRRLKVN